MDRKSAVSRITFNAMMLALFCVVGMFSIPLGDNVKVSLQLLMVFLIGLIAPGIADALIVVGCYILLGLIAPIYAGFTAGVSPTFGFVLGFFLAMPAIYFLNKVPKLPWPLKKALACLAGLLIVYASGSVFMMLYLKLDFGSTLLLSVVPYLPFDAAKIALAVPIAHFLRKIVHNARSNA